MAVSMVSTRAELLTSDASALGGDTFIGWREKSLPSFSYCNSYGRGGTNRSGSLVQTECSGKVLPWDTSASGSRVPDLGLAVEN